MTHHGEETVAAVERSTRSNINGFSHLDVGDKMFLTVGELKKNDSFLISITHQ